MKDRTVTIIVVGAMLVIGILYYLNMDDGRKHFQWYESYEAASEQPYGVAFMRKMLEGYRPGGRFVFNDSKRLKDVLDDVDDHRNTDYVFIGQDIFLDEEGSLALSKFIEAGGNAFIASLTDPEQILSSTYFNECGLSIGFARTRSPSVSMNFFHDDLMTGSGVSYRYRFGATDQPYTWKYIWRRAFCDSTKLLVPLGFFDDHRVNMVRIQVGEGFLYLHSNPIVFTNYFLTQQEKVEYAGKVFSHLDGRDIIWDEFSKIPLSGNDNSFSNPMYFILQQPSLKYAWWLIVLTAALYVLFAAKRKQRVIPVMETKTNTSLEFVNLISRLHYRNGNHLDMAQKKMKYFLYFVRSRYGIQAERFGEDQIRRLAEKSKVNISDVEVIFSRYYLIEERFKNNIEVNRLVDLYDSIENFYRQTK